MKFPATFLIFLAVVSYPVKLTAQQGYSDSAFYQSAVYNALEFYQQSVRDQSRLFNGREYKPYRIPFIKGHPFFQSEKFQDGSIVYEDGAYTNVKLLYDEVKGMVILGAGINLELITDRIGQFTISGHTFTRLPPDTLNNKLGDGFYERLYAGKIELYKKEQKTIGEDLSDTEGVRGVVSAKKYYYIRRRGQYYPVKNRNGMYEILKDKKNELQAFVKSNGLDFRNDTDNTLTKVAAYYDQLTK